MEIKDDKLIINTEQVDAVGGAKPEPEERPAVRKMITDVRVGGNAGGFLSATLPKEVKKVVDGQAYMPGAVAQETTVGEFLTHARPCGSCIHFDKEKMRAMIVKWKSSTDPFDKYELDKLRRSTMSQQRIDQMIARKEDPDALLLDLGVCIAWTRYYLDLNMTPAQATTIAHPMSTCPGTDMAGFAVKSFYKPMHEKLVSAARDDVLFKAAGKKV